MEALNYVASHHDFSGDAVIAFTSSDNFQLLNDKELLLDNKLFDIVRSERTGSGIIYYAISDDKEDAFWNAVSELAKSNSDAHQLPGKSISPDILKFLGEETFYNAGSLILEQPCSSNSYSSSFIYQSPFGEIYSPPPKAAIA